MQGYELTCRSRVLPRARSISPKLVPWRSGAASGARRVLACEPARQTVLSISMNIHAIRPAVAEALTAPFLLMPLVVPESPLRLPHGGSCHGVLGGLVLVILVPLVCAGGRPVASTLRPRRSSRGSPQQSRGPTKGPLTPQRHSRDARRLRAHSQGSSQRTHAWPFSGLTPSG
jgi:hypothetical protein